MADNYRAPDFRYIFANGFVLSMNGDNALITFGMDFTALEGKPGLREQVGILMSPVTAKILAHTLMATIRAVESESGEIWVPPGKIDQLDDLIARSKRLAGEPPKSSN